MVMKLGRGMSMSYCSFEVAFVNQSTPMVLAHEAQGVHVEVVYVLQSTNENNDD